MTSRAGRTSTKFCELEKGETAAPPPLPGLVLVSILVNRSLQIGNGL